jgi:hypothetical protein
VTTGSLGRGGGQRPGDDAGEPGRDVAGKRGIEQRPFVGDREVEDLAGKLRHCVYLRCVLETLL